MVHLPSNPKLISSRFALRRVLSMAAGAAVGASLLLSCTRSEGPPASVHDGSSGGPEAPATMPTAEAPGATAAEELAEIQRKNLESFDIVWRTIDERHYDAELGGVDWDAAREKYRPRVEEAGSVAEARQHMQEMIDLLGQSHMAIIPASAYETFAGQDASAQSGDGEGGEEEGDVPQSSVEGDTGMRVRLVDPESREVLVTEVKPGSGAEAAGVQPGWQLLRIGEDDVKEVVGTIVEAITARGHGKPEMYASFALMGRLQGEEGERKQVTLMDGDGQERTVEIELEAAPGELTRLGHLPPVRVDFEWRREEKEGVTLGYIGFDAFMDPPRLSPLLEAAMRDFTNPEDPVDGVVLDVRGNVGGIVMMVPGIAGYFVNERGVTMGTLDTRETELKLVIFPRTVQFAGPLAVLTDTCSVSAAELLSGGLQGIGRARVFGLATAGEALPAQFTRLPNEDGFLFVFADYQTADSKRLEGDGVLPDEVVPYDRATLLAGEDPMLQAAAEWIRREVASRPAAPEGEAPATQPADVADEAGSPATGATPDAPTTQATTRPSTQNNQP